MVEGEPHMMVVVVVVAVEEEDIVDVEVRMLCNVVDLEEPGCFLVQEPSKDLPENRPTHYMWTAHSVWLWASHKR